MTQFVTILCQKLIIIIMNQFSILGSELLKIMKIFDFFKAVQRQNYKGVFCSRRNCDFVYLDSVLLEFVSTLSLKQHLIPNHPQ